MTSFDAATRAQIDATAPEHSTWLSANAGSGKTRVLTNRVALLLLTGAHPQNIVCLTYTNAAAVEMQNRLVDRLGTWAMMPDDKLRNELVKLGHDKELSHEKLKEARTLFASAIETPGGLRIQTIHSFCSSIMRRFPLEAEVSPLFRELDERAGAALRSDILRSMAVGQDAGVMAAVLANYTQLEFDKFVSEIGRYRDQVSKDLELPTIRSWYGLDPHLNNADLPMRTIEDSDLADLRSFVDALRALGQTRATENANTLNLHDLKTVDEPLLETLWSVFLTKTNTVKKNIAPAKIKKEQRDLADRIEALAERVHAANLEYFAERAVDATLALHRFASTFLERYETAKRERGFLDFDDLIRGTEHLLTDPRVADWVLYKLDGGIDHVLVDEAQDTNPAQWRVIKLLTQNMTEPAVNGARRTIFVVGDKKQSIYSFQGAEPAAFDEMCAYYEDFLAQTGTELGQKSLDHSFRSAAAILRTVDRVFENAGDINLTTTGHIPFYQDMPGRVDLWPPVLPQPKQAEKVWTDLSDPEPKESERVELADKIAHAIQDMISTGQITNHEGETRRIKGGDILILVQRRSELFNHIINACKRLNLPIAGSDRLKLGGELAVNDLRALLSFLALPQDSLALATALRSPLFGWTEKQLFDVAHGRKSTELWVELTNQARDFPHTMEILNDLRRLVDYMPPYELLEHILTRWNGRTNLISRLGSEAEEGIDILLNKAREYDAGAPASLTGFLAWLEKDETDVKRQAEQAGENLRVMTVHGAKGLEAPIVILPDTAERREPNTEPLMLDTDKNLIWKTSKGQAPQHQLDGSAAIAERMTAERLRLLYVAMTRAESWLIVCSAGDKSDGASAWYQKVDDALRGLGADELEMPTGQGLRYSEGIWPKAVAPLTGENSVDRPQLPAFFAEPVHAPVREKPPMNPSKMGGEKVLTGADGPVSADASAKGTAIHLLLEKADLLDLSNFDESAQRILTAAQTNLVDADLADAIRQAQSVLATPEFSFMFGTDSLAEVEFSVPASIDGHSRIHGIIDRMVVTEGHVRVIDFKSNSQVPDRYQDVPEGLINQMRAYYLAACALYPNRQVSCAILWTAEPRLMEIPQNIVSQPINSLTRS